MAGIMAMGADFGFNVFIVLSGMIESLREQTEQRISKLLSNTNGDRVWEKIVPQNYQNNFLSSVYRPDKNLYMVVLKNKTRLENLLDWLQGDKNVAENLKVLIIDDESDQASTNTSKDPENDRKTINRLIVNLVHNKDKTNKYNDFSFRSINYVGYTATPYANILSESPDNLESLYPQNFIATLTESPQHFGPREIFGYLDEERSEPLNIVNFIKDKDEITQLLLGEKKELPKSLKEAIAYFISASASL